MPENGSILVRVYTSDAQLPVEDAAVAITQPVASGGSHLLAARLTDESGNIDPVEVPAPAETQSQAPGVQRPFTSVNVAVSHPDYEQVLVENVQIFSGVQTQQDIKLIPNAERPDAWNLTEVFDITPQPL